jgi:hypothetical protein
MVLQHWKGIYGILGLANLRSSSESHKGQHKVADTVEAAHNLVEAIIDPFIDS